MRNLSSVRLLLLMALSLIGFLVLPALARSADPMLKPHPEIHLERTLEAANKHPHLKYEGRPKILFFYAQWAKPCQLIEPVMHANMQKWGKEIDFVDVDVDDPKNGQLVEKYSVGPIPTVIFVNPRGTVTHMLVGYSGARAVISQIKQLAPHS